MTDPETDLAVDPLEPAPFTERPRNRRGRFRDRRLAHDADEGTRAELYAEVLLLREENARLKAARYERPSLGALLARARTLPASGATRDDLGDEAAQMLLEGLVLRESLLAVCEEIERSMAAVRGRLAELDADAPGEVVDDGADPA